MGTLLGTALVLVVLGVLIFPFIRRKAESASASDTHAKFRAERLRLAKLVADLDQDRKSGSVNEEEYVAQLGELRVRAARSLRDEDEVASSSDDGGSLEREIAAARGGRD